MQTLRIKAFFALTFLFFFSMHAQIDIYWVGGNGDWHDTGMWYKDAAGVNSAGTIPNSNSIVHFTDQSSTIPDWNARIQPGNYNVHSIIVETNDDFRIFLNGTDNNNQVIMNVYGDIDFLSTHRLEYGATSTYDCVWRFVGANSHDVISGGQDLKNIEIHDENGTLHQLDNLTATEQIRMFAGTWNSNGHDITTDGKLWFKDGNTSSNPLSKTFNSGSSDIQCYEWASGFTYGEFAITGNHTIRASKFRGSPTNGFEPPIQFHEIHLLEYSDTPSGGAVIEYNNFECENCEINSLTVEDTGDTKFANSFTVTGKFTVVNQGSSILFNSGNTRGNEVTLNGLIITPKVLSCSDPRTIFSTIHTDLTIFKRISGTLNLNDAVVNNIQTMSDGGAVFNLSGGILQGSSTGWNLINIPTSVDYYWKGIAGATGNWNDISNWVDINGNTIGCLPTLADDVYVVESSKGDIRIQSPYNAKCRNFIWTNKDGLNLTLDGQSFAESALTVAGNFDLNSSANIIPVMNHEIYFSSASSNYIETRGVELPEIWFSGNLGSWTLEDDLICDKFTFEGGTLSTLGNDVTTVYWNCIDENPKHFNLSTSHITVNGEMALSRSTFANVTVNPGTSLIECEDLTSAVTDLYNVQLNNSSGRLMENYPYNFNSFILNGTGLVSTQNDMTLNDLIFLADGSALAVDITDDFTINGGIESMTSVGTPAELKSRTVGVRTAIDKLVGNICVSGFVKFTDINAALSGVFNAPDGIDGGNNIGINYADGAVSTTGYWIGGSGKWDVISNWSQISGGCPSTKNPNNFLSLIFDNFGFYESAETITVVNPTLCQQMFFYNSASSVTFDITLSLSPTKVVVANGDVSVEGTLMNVRGETIVESGGYLSTDMNNYTTESLESSSGLLIVRNGSNFLIEE